MSGLSFRLNIILVLFLVAFTLIVGRAFQLQVINKKDLSSRARRQHRKLVRIIPGRGTIFDRNMNELAISREVDSVYANPQKIAQPELFASKVAKWLPVNYKALNGKLTSKKRFVWLKRQIELGKFRRESILKLRGVGLLKESKRFYPDLKLASNVIGFVGFDSVGLEGIEMRYNDYLLGTGAKVYRERDAFGDEMYSGDLTERNKFNGKNIVLTLDKNIQHISEKLIGKVIEDTHAKGGVIIVMQPYTGEILAMASKPNFDPNRFWNYSPGEWRNRAVGESYEPGSIFKVFLVSAAVETGAVTPGTMIYCEDGEYSVGKTVFHDVEKNKWLSVSDIVRFSSNIGAIKIGEHLGKERYERFISTFGFGKRTGIDLPGESAGIVKDLSRSSISLSTASFGQGISVTSIQLISALSAVANGGLLMKPYIVKSILNRDGSIVESSHPEIIRRVISDRTANAVTKIMEGVTFEGGTGEKAYIKGINIAGKTGTAQKPDNIKGGYMPDSYVSSFFGFAPASSPELAVLVMVDDPKGTYYGGKIAAPVFREIVRESMAYLELFPGGVGEEMQSAIVSRERKESTTTETSGYTPDFRGKSMRNVLRTANSMQIDVKMSGSGRVVSQDPLAGTFIDRDRVVDLVFN